MTRPSWAGWLPCCAASDASRGGGRRAAPVGSGPAVVTLVVAGVVARLGELLPTGVPVITRDRKSTRLNSSHVEISYAVFCLKKKKKTVGRVFSQNRKRAGTQR